MQVNDKKDYQFRKILVNLIFLKARQKKNKAVNFGGSLYKSMTNMP